MTRNEQRLAELEGQVAAQAAQLGRLSAELAVQSEITRILMETRAASWPVPTPRRPRHLQAVGDAR